jgi:hypothetical protein
LVYLELTGNQVKFGILITFFASETFVLSQTLLAINYIVGFGFSNLNALPLSIQFCIEGIIKKIVA